MNLHKIANAAIITVHPNETITIYKSDGQENVYGIIKPKYLAPEVLEAQVQDQTDTGLVLADAITQTGHSKLFYVNKYSKDNALVPFAQIRQQGRSGDIIKRADGTFWHVTSVVEEFDLHIVLKAELLTQEPDFSGQEWYEEKIAASLRSSQ